MEIISIEAKGQLEVGKQWLWRSMDLGNGNAGITLSDSYGYPFDTNIDGIINRCGPARRWGVKNV